MLENENNFTEEEKTRLLQKSNGSGLYIYRNEHIKIIKKEETFPQKYNGIFIKIGEPILNITSDEEIEKMTEVTQNLIMETILTKFLKKKESQINQIFEEHSEAIVKTVNEWKNENTSQIKKEKRKSD
jgi:hypothetical protein